MNPYPPVPQPQLGSPARLAPPKAPPTDAPLAMAGSPAAPLETTGAYVNVRQAWPPAYAGSSAAAGHVPAEEDVPHVRLADRHQFLHGPPADHLLQWADEEAAEQGRQGRRDDPFAPMVARIHLGYGIVTGCRHFFDVFIIDNIFLVLLSFVIQTGTEGGATKGGEQFVALW